MSQARYMILAGPTGVGKTDLAIAIAQQLKSEIIGADAFQIYRGLDLLTGKPSSEQLSAVQHHLISCLDLEVASNAQAYAMLAIEKVEKLNQRGIIPL
ncbi:MAG: AAA family ATPase, partial [Verrucomicrobia bacterium]|nr:AAA family ATPase [Verrucomicrobiota bacterium]